jgi:hypothetical protein
MTKEWPQVPSTCGAPVIWCLTTTRDGKMPVNPEPVETGGNITLRDTGGDQPLAVVLTVTQQFGRRNLYVSHFATCPHAARHRRTGTSRKLGS